MAVAGWGMQSRAGCCSLCVALVLVHGAVLTAVCLCKRRQSAGDFFWNENRRNAASKTLA